MGFRVAGSGMLQHRRGAGDKPVPAAGNLVLNGLDGVDVQQSLRRVELWGEGERAWVASKP